jgi:hypothetical protein
MDLWETAENLKRELEELGWNRINPTLTRYLEG